MSGPTIPERVVAHAVEHCVGQRDKAGEPHTLYALRAMPRMLDETCRVTAVLYDIIEFRRRTLLPLDDVLGCLSESIPRLTRSALHRCLVRHGISRLPKDEENASKQGRFAETAIGHVHVDHCEPRLAEGRLRMFLAIDRVSALAHVTFFDAADKLNGPPFLHDVVATFHYAIQRCCCWQRSTDHTGS